MKHITTSILPDSSPKNNNSNFETIVSNRLRSIFAAFGNTISDFYLETGIYFVGGFNALIVAWEIFTDLSTIKGQPFLYSALAGLVAFIAVEGLAVYLVGAAAKTNNGWLWFFSVVFATFFTYAHYREINNPGLIAWYITLAVPFFVVAGYWARTLKIEAESKEKKSKIDQESELARRQRLEDEERLRKQRLEDEERARQRQIEDQKLAHEMAMELAKLEAQNEIKRLKVEAQKSAQTAQKSAHFAEMDRSMDRINEPRVNRKMDRQNAIIELVKVEPDMKPTELKNRLNELGHEASVSTIKRDLASLNGKLKEVANG